MAVLDTDQRRNVSVSARVRFAGGQRSGGIVWRVQDAENYYLARLDLDRQDIGLYRVAGGNRTRIEGEDDLELDTAAWHTLRVVQEEENIRVYLGGIRVLRARDRTFGQAGRHGPVVCRRRRRAFRRSPAHDAGGEEGRCGSSSRKMKRIWRGRCGKP